MNKKYFIHHTAFRLLAPVIYGVLVYLLILLINNNLSQLKEIFIGQEVYICIGLTVLVFESSRLSIVLVTRYLSKNLNHLTFPIQILSSIILSLGLVMVSLTQYFNWIIGFSIATSQLFIFCLIYTLTALLYNLLYYSNFYLNQENTLKITAEKQQQEVLELEISEFKNDINPDLLYESLECTIGLIYQDKEKAEEYIDCLAATYRYTLTNRHQEFISVQLEIQAAQDVVKLLNEKYHNQLRLDVQTDILKQNFVLIPGSLPIAVENIARNTIITQNEPLIISCYLDDDDYLILQSKLNDRLMLHEESLQSFKRLQKSYGLYSDKPMIQVKAYAENYIKFPVVKVFEEVPALS